MDATYIQNTIVKLKTDIFMHVRHRTLLKHLDEPAIDENRLFYLLLPLFNKENWTEEHYESAITVGIIYSALATHDEIQELNATSKEQQLKVLAGDFYSGRYYEILAHSGNIPLIQKLSQGIVKRCENQIKVYEANEYTFEEWLQTLVVIESELIEQFFRLYNFEQYIPVIQKGLLLSRLREELMCLNNGKQTSIMKAIAVALENQIPSVSLEQQLQQSILELSSEMEHLLAMPLLLHAMDPYLKFTIESVSQRTGEV